MKKNARPEKNMESGEQAGIEKDSSASSSMQRAIRKFPGKDFIAGLTLSIPSIPDVMASATLAGVNPIYGLYSLMIGTPVAAIFTSSVFMNAVTTGAMSIAIAGGLADYQGDQLVNALVTIGIIVGIVQLAAGLLKLGFLTRFVSNSVMTGFITGIAVLIILSQTGTLTGFDSEYTNKLAKNYDLFTHLDEVSLTTTLLGTGAILLIVLLNRGFLNKFAMLIAVVASIIVMIIFEPESVKTVSDIGEIPSGLPRPYLPVPVWDFGLVLSGFAVAIIGLLQGTGISSEYPNPDGKYPSISRDFSGQGIANLAVSLFRGVPVGGSMSATSMIVLSGARSRWANIFTGLLAIIAVLLLRDLIVKMPMSVLGAILIVAGFQAINFERIRTAWETGMTQKFIMLLTFIAVLLLPIVYAVFIGIMLHFILHIFRSASGFKIVQLEPVGDGTFRETPVPEKLPSRNMTILQPIGDLFFAGAGYMSKILPSAENSERAVVIIRLRRQKEIGSTFIQIIDRYAGELKANGGKLLLVGVGGRIYDQLERTGILEKLGEENIYSSTEILTESLNRAISDASKLIEADH